MAKFCTLTSCGGADSGFYGSIFLNLRIHFICTFYFESARTNNSKRCYNARDRDLGRMTALLGPGLSTRSPFFEMLKFAGVNFLFNDEKKNIIFPIKSLRVYCDNPHVLYFEPGILSQTIFCLFTILPIH